MQLKTAIIICGRISSGKTHVANQIRKNFGFPVASFGSYLKHYCEMKNFPTDRKSLQEIGEQFIRANPQQFLNDVINYFIGDDDTIIVEGVRHRIIFDSIKNLANNCLSIFIEADQKIRYDRYCFRRKESDSESITTDQFLIADNHRVELEIETLKPLCNIVIDSTKDYSSELFAFLSKWEGLNLKNNP